MLRSLVGSEMCIRDRRSGFQYGSLSQLLLQWSLCKTLRRTHNDCGARRIRVLEALSFARWRCTRSICPPRPSHRLQRDRAPASRKQKQVRLLNRDGIKSFQRRVKACGWYLFPDVKLSPRWENAIQSKVSAHSRPQSTMSRSSGSATISLGNPKIHATARVPNERWAALLRRSEIVEKFA